MMLSPYRAVVYAVIIAIGGFVFGFDASVIGGVVGYITSQFGLAPWQVGVVVSAPTFAAIFASLSVGFVSDRIGRRRVLLLLAFLYVLSAGASACATGFVSLTIARAVGGYAFGSLSQAAIYIAEISPSRARGRMVAINQMTIVVGISTAYFTNLAIQTLSGSPALIGSGLMDEPWRWMLGLEIVPAGIWLFALLYVPESPRWLATQQRWREAEAVLAQLLRSDAEVRDTLSAMKQQLGTHESTATVRLGQLVHPRLRFALLLGFILAVIQQVTGINTVFFYATTIFEQSGVGTDAAFVQAVFVGLINVVVTAVAMLAIDRWGRRPLMIIGLVGVCVSMGLVTYGFSEATYQLTPGALSRLSPVVDVQLLEPLVGKVYESDLSFKAALTESLGERVLRDNEAAFLKAGMQGRPWLILVGILLFVAAFALSLGPVMWVFLSEIFPGHVRGAAVSLITVFNSGSSWLVQFLFPIQLAYTGIASVFLGYAAWGLVGLVLVVWLMPETKGLSLEEIEREIVVEGEA